MLILLVVVVLAVVVAVFIWNFRRQAAAREAASAERMKAFLDQARGGVDRAPSMSTSAAAPVTPTPDAASGARPQLEVALRAPLLSSEQRAIYPLLKSALPEHEIFPSLSLATFVQPAPKLSGFAREAQERRLADAVADFVVCDKAMNPVAAVQCVARSGKSADIEAFAAACLTSNGVRWVELSAHTPLRLDEVRQRVVGS